MDDPDMGVDRTAGETTMDVMPVHSQPAHAVMPAVVPVMTMPVPSRPMTPMMPPHVPMMMMTDDPAVAHVVPTEMPGMAISVTMTVRPGLRRITQSKQDDHDRHQKLCSDPH